MRENALLLACLAAGVAAGAAGWAPEALLRPGLAMGVLGALVLQVGLGLGVRGDLRALLGSLRWPMLLLPLFTIGGTLLAMLAAGALLAHRPLADVMAAGSGFGYYSLSSLLIVEAHGRRAGQRAARAAGPLWLCLRGAAQRGLCRHLGGGGLFDGRLPAGDSPLVGGQVAAARSDGPRPGARGERPPARDGLLPLSGRSDFRPFRLALRAPTLIFAIVNKK